MNVALASTAKSLPYVHMHIQQRGRSLFILKSYSLIKILVRKVVLAEIAKRTL